MVTVAIIWNASATSALSNTQSGTNTCNITVMQSSCTKTITFAQPFTTIPAGTATITSIPVSQGFVLTVPMWYHNGSISCTAFVTCTSPGNWTSTQVQNEMFGNDMHDVPFGPPASVSGTDGVTLYLTCSFLQGNQSQIRIELHEGSNGVQGPLVSFEQFDTCPTQTGVDFGTQGIVNSYLSGAVPVWSLWMQCTTSPGTYPSPAPCSTTIWWTAFFIVCNYTLENIPLAVVNAISLTQIQVKVFLQFAPAATYTGTFSWRAG